MRLFLYGTLMAASDTPMARWLSSRLGDAEAGTVPGRMVAVPGANGWFPAMFEGPGRVCGMVCEVRPGPGDMARLDRYEGREYRRVTVRVRTVRGLIPAQAWLWRAGLPTGSVPVPSGDFLSWLADRGAPMFAARNGARRAPKAP